MSNEIRWEEPPFDLLAERAGSRKRFIQALKKRPGEWAVYPVKAASAAAVASRFRSDFPGVEAVCQNSTVYIRWVGEVEK